MLLYRALVCLVPALAVPSVRGQAPRDGSATNPSAQRYTKSSIEQTNDDAKRLRAGDNTAAADLTHTLFDKIGLGPDFADTLAFTDRISQADASFRRGERAGIREAKVVSALNSFFLRTAALPWAQTTPEELRKLRMHLVATYPHLMASQAPPDEHGNYNAIEGEMSPMEASYLASTMVYQKIFNPEYQLSSTERLALDESSARQLHLERTREMNDLLVGRTGNGGLPNLLAAGQALFTDMGIPSVPRSKATSGGAK